MKLMVLLYMGLTMFLSGCGDNVELKIDEIFKEFNEKTPGAAVAVFKDSELFFSKGYGLADLQSGTKITSATNFRLASVTKQFTAASILLLIRDGKFELDSKLVDLIPEFPAYGKSITIKHLLQHTSGLLDYEDYIDDTVTTQLQDVDVLAILIKQDSLYFEPGEMHKYSNSGYAVLSQIVERVSGQNFPDFLTDRIFKPLKMDNTLAFIKNYNVISNRSFGYAKDGESFVFSDQSETSAVLGDGGIYTSIQDMLIWDRALNNAAILNVDELIASWTKGITNGGAEFNYGYGWRLDEHNGNLLIYHTGSTCGYSNVYMRFPEQKLSVLVLINIRDYDAFDMGKQVSDIFLDSK